MTIKATQQRHIIDEPIPMYPTLARTFCGRIVALGVAPVRELRMCARCRALSARDLPDDCIILA